MRTVYNKQWSILSNQLQQLSHDNDRLHVENSSLNQELNKLFSLTKLQAAQIKLLRQKTNQPEESELIGNELIDLEQITEVLTKPKESKPSEQDKRDLEDKDDTTATLLPQDAPGDKNDVQQLAQWVQMMIEQQTNGDYVDVDIGDLAEEDIDIEPEAEQDGI
ncbi:hypothetical protein RFI_02487 [Reticulomyxa filosa]|uniref:Uncharacterized protein n=1 Tax=Reticulomyxa filosa TaxID=46433 RepID=X6P8S9_RETFI|nr:hypothetical protein RFI_02487 [Reticulomyxa filosa]|eukprot:ETO34601.1 hypothetical protein RFI_02487 [Reticulomyxa filosa]